MDMFDPLTNVFTHFRYDPKNPQSICSNRVHNVFCDSQGLLWVSTDKGINIINTKTFEIKHVTTSSDPKSLRSNDIFRIIEDKDHNIWISTYGGLSLLEKEKIPTLEFKNFFNNPSKPYSLSNDLVRCVYQDGSGIIWIGNFSKGVDWFLPGNDKFTSYHYEPDNPKSLQHNIIRSIKEDKEGFIWVCTYGGGLNRFNPNTEEFMLVDDYITGKRNENQLFVNALEIDVQDNLWIGTWGDGLYFYNRKSGQSKHFTYNPNNPNSLSYNLIRSMLIDHNGMLWIATSGGGLNQFNPKTNSFTHYRSDKNDPSTICDDRIMGLMEDHKGNIWVGSSNYGLNKMDIKTGKFTRYQNNPDNPKSISSNRIFCIYETKDRKTVWVGTGNGLNKFNPEDTSFTYFSKKDGLNNDVILGILEDNNGLFWLTTMDGLYKFEPGTGRVIKRYDESDGLQSNEFNERASLKDRSGKIYVGGNNGISIFDPDKLVENHFIPPVYIVDFLLFNKSMSIDSTSILKQSIIQTKEIHLDYKDYVFSFEFAALNYINSDKNQYMYKMEGFDKDWIPTDSKRRFVTYTNLDHNEYFFKVKASNNDGIWNEDGTAIKIIIDPPIWFTWWFRLISFFILVSCLIGFYMWRVTSLQRQKKVLEEKVTDKTAEVVLQKEKLEEVNEELTQSNLELNNQRHELEATLQSLKDAQFQVLQSEKMASLGILAAGVAHEINNPLNYIQGGIDALKDYFRQNLLEHFDQLIPMVNVIQLGVDRTAEIVRSLGHYSRTNDNSFNECDIHPIIDNCLVILQNEMRNRIQIERNYTRDRYILLGNEGKLHQVFLNILHNASYAIADKGIISISTRVKDNDLIIDICDNGCGISEENLNKIMDPFFTTKEPGKGTGLGLAITYNIIQEHNGKITCESQVNVGTKFEIKFPVMR